MEKSNTQPDEKVILCTECGEVYEPANGHADIRCVNCGNHQDPITLAEQFMKRTINATYQK